MQGTCQRLFEILIFVSMTPKRHIQRASSNIIVTPRVNTS